MRVVSFWYIFWEFYCAVIAILGAVLAFYISMVMLASMGRMFKWMPKNVNEVKGP